MMINFRSTRTMKWLLPHRCQWTTSLTSLSLAALLFILVKNNVQNQSNSGMEYEKPTENGIKKVERSDEPYGTEVIQVSSPQQSDIYFGGEENPEVALHCYNYRSYGMIELLRNKSKRFCQVRWRWFQRGDVETHIIYKIGWENNFHSGFNTSFAIFGLNMSVVKVIFRYKDFKEDD